MHIATIFCGFLEDDDAFFQERKGIKASGLIIQAILGNDR